MLLTPPVDCGSFFGKQLSSDLLAKLNPTAKKNGIFGCEFFALFGAFLLWGCGAMGAVVIYTDNNAVRDSMIACHSPNAIARKIFVATLGWECERQLTPWYTRIPTDSNLAGGPSRLKFDDVLRLGACSCEKNVVWCWDELVAFAAKWGEDQASTPSRVSK